jgi:hypothetical protein
MVASVSERRKQIRGADLDVTNAKNPDHIGLFGRNCTQNPEPTPHDTSETQSRRIRDLSPRLLRSVASTLSDTSIPSSNTFYLDGKHTGEKNPTKYWRFSIFLDFAQGWGTQSATVPA